MQGEGQSGGMWRGVSQLGLVHAEYLGQLGLPEAGCQLWGAH